MTTRPKKDWFWHLTHSLWLGWLFSFGLLHWVSFLYAGLRTRRWRWVGMAAFYVLPVVAILMLPTHRDGDPYTWRENGTYAWYALSALVSFVHGFLIRKEYTLRVEAYDRVSDERLKSRIEAEYGVELDEAAPPVAYTVKSLDALVDLNRADEDQLAALPGVGRVLAEIAIDMRRRQGPFRSVEGFGDAIGLKPAQIEALRPLVTLGLTAPQADEQAEEPVQRGMQREPQSEA